MVPGSSYRMEGLIDEASGKSIPYNYSVASQVATFQVLSSVEKYLSMYLIGSLPGPRPSAKAPSKAIRTPSAMQ